MAAVPSRKLALIQLQAPRQLVHSQHGRPAFLLAWDARVRYTYVRPRLGHLQLPVVATVCEILEAQHLPGVVKARLVSRHRMRPRDQVLRTLVVLRKHEVSVGCPRVKGQRTTVCDKRICILKHFLEMSITLVLQRTMKHCTINEMPALLQPPVFFVHSFHYFKTAYDSDKHKRLQ